MDRYGKVQIGWDRFQKVPNGFVRFQMVLKVLISLIFQKVLLALDQNAKHSKQLTCPNFLLEHPHIREDRVSCCSICGK